jgi:hypothetical protein
MGRPLQMNRQPDYDDRTEYLKAVESAVTALG